MRIPLAIASLALLGVAAAPPGQEGPRLAMLAPGFKVEVLPVRTSNLNAIAFGPGGTLYAAGYDGRILRLVDADGDGLEDKAEPFWDRGSIITPIALVWAPEGLYVSSHRKVVLLRDDDRDGRADREEIVAEGWPPIENVGGNVDALGLARDADGNLYFGLGCMNYANPYLVKDGQSHYDIKNERGTILELSADRKRREIVATGIRFPYALKFNRRGDLFATDQEGATWLPGGNPLDELNHIERGKHYGFPPRHEAYLPHVKDQAPVVGFGPQHQSACGLAFDEEAEGRERFGPADWEGDALVGGFSRGKVFRVRLAKTPEGYLGRPTIVAAANRMLLDLAIAPSGALYVIGHSGDPDWGTGPQGPGTLFKITYVDSNEPQPVLAWPSGPLEVRVAFDRPIDAAAVAGLKGATIPFGDSVRAADRLEVFKPPYKVVEGQQAEPKGSLRVAAARLADGGRTLVLATDPHPRAAHYAVSVPNVKAPKHSQSGTTVDLDYDLSGVEASWSPGKAEDAKPAWSGWWPHVDSVAVTAFTKGSAEHARELETLAKEGRLTLRGQLRLPKGKGALRVRSGGPVLAASHGIENVETQEKKDISIPFESTGDAEELALTIGTGGGPFTLHVTSSSEADPTGRPLSLGMLSVPWAPISPPAPASPTAPTGPLAGGDPKRGEAVFFGTEAKCSSCHKVRGKGGEVGPDLSNLVQRDLASVYRDLAEPSAVIHPDFVPYTVSLKDGRVAVGVVRAEGSDAIRVADTNAKTTLIPRAEIDELRPSATSIMPVGLVGAIGEARVRDLLAFLTTAPKADDPPKTDEKGPPPPRTRAEVEAVLGHPIDQQPEADARPRPLNVVLVTTAQDHGPGEHDYPAWRSKWKDLLKLAPGVNAATADAWPNREQWAKADLVVFYFWNHDWNRDRYQDLDDFLARGGGLVFLHSATIADAMPEVLAKRLGIASCVKQGTKYRHGPLDLAIADPDEPITRNLRSVHLIDETYWGLVGDPKDVHVLARAVEEGKPWPMAWTRTVGKGRVFCTVLGHYSWTYEDPLFRLLILRGMAWAAGEPVGRLEPLATVGVPLRAGR
ncbi:MAG TPA: ThuA domain-containing protein [Isosphaeraceae bacterium]|jgi:putative heme-binding domain-containing protein|nr:ThuA domain-containing protein [Isosphaeraceae bacterium]